MATKNSSKTKKSSAKKAATKKSGVKKKAVTKVKAAPKKKSSVKKKTQTKKKTTASKKVSAAKKTTKAKLASKKKPVKKATTSKSKVQKKAEPKKVTKPSRKKVVAKKSNSPKKVSERKTAAKPAVATPEVVAPIVPLVPSPKALKKFRKAAKENKKLQQKRAKARTRQDGFIAKSPKAGKSFKVDLRVHSPGTVGFFTMGGVETASALVRLAKVKGLDIVGVTDYYNGIAIDEVKEVAKQSNLTVIPGVDLCCRVGICDEVHLSALFPESFSSSNIFELLSVLNVPTAMYGRQDYCLELDLSIVLQEVESRGGVVIPTRLDKTPHRQLAIRPLVEQYGFHAFDVVYPDNLECFRDWPNGQFTFVGFSNAYSLGQVGSRSEKIKLSEPTFEAIRERFKRRPIDTMVEAA